MKETRRVVAAGEPWSRARVGPRAAPRSPERSAAMRSEETVLARLPRTPPAEPTRPAPEQDPELAKATASTRFDTESRLDPAAGDAPRRLLGALPRLALHGRGAEPAEYDLRAVIGEGGMGLVRDAVQLSIGREVAVKTVHPNQRDNRHVVSDLLTEAQITGALEHPNIVPIYSLGCDDEGLPLIVMKRIDGAVWSEVLRDPAHALLSGAGEERLSWHLAILGQVCRAVHFAHSRGIVHRDLKPANVMIGAFGEVYVLDWGLALHVDPATGAARTSTASGTPAYMAPEMVETARAPITARTDVFLLGAILHEILTGRPPWAGSKVSEALAQARACAPSEALVDVPAPLAAITRRAMSAAPEERYASAEALRLAIEEYIRHRGAASLAAHAERSLAELRELVAPTHDEDVADEDHPRRDESRIHGLFGECRFGFDRALAEWPESQVALKGRMTAYLLMIEHELRARRPGAAAALLDELDVPPPALVDRVEALRRALAHDAARLELLEREVDVNAHVGTRQRVFIFSCVFLLLWNAGAELLARTTVYRAEYLAYGGLNTVSLVFLVGLWWRLGATELRSTFNRVYGMAFSATAGSTMLIWLALGAAGTPFTWALALANVPQIVGAATVAFGIDARMRWLPVVYIVTGALGLIWPEHVYVWAAASSLVGMLVVIKAWQLPRPEVVRSRDLH